MYAHMIPGLKISSAVLLLALYLACSSTIFRDDFQRDFVQIADEVEFDYDRHVGRPVKGYQLAAECMETAIIVFSRSRHRAYLAFPPV